MHPAFSVIFLTTLLGVGQGMFIALVFVQLLTTAGIVQTELTPEFFAYGTGVVLVFVGLALFASFFHLGHPERAMRTVTQWKTSWLSREVIALPAFGVGALLYGVIHFFSWDFILLETEDMLVQFSLVIGLLGIGLSITLWICTGMIYACIKFLQEWATPLTVVNFIMLGMASGYTAATVYASFVKPEMVQFFAWSAILFTVLAAITRISALIRNLRIKPKSTPTTAIGIRHKKIVQKSQGAMGGSYNTREYFHGKSDGFISLIKWGFLVLTFVVPVIFLILGMAETAMIALIIAAAVQYVGLLAERWYFFADSNHPQNIYYQGV
ncbi:MAG: Anaerobic dimethyl sulfoxide reductase chain C (EC [uncultured Thiotrichaceae bacterium]|uniref:Anaerobic dimethyl sulfoxide reductase chain C (EC) n=1 Tax=uncultured Thiotrichaceae bacterium TaxID=298394 RepID=A0A6S6U487_9GAMM|nr:MAG: Anaerobic dimethyl sulfoxide reductase chain C (EC [uncultured Thiotrichaceae bacterium]